MWVEPFGWTGPVPVYYQSFNCPFGLSLMEGNAQADFPVGSRKGNVIMSTPASVQDLCRADAKHIFRMKQGKLGVLFNGSSFIAT